MNPKAYRLPTHVRPRRYDLHLDARLGQSSFNGAVNIAVDIKEARDVIELHARDLHFTQAQLSAGGQVRMGTVSLDPEREIAAIHFDAPLPIGSANLRLAFTGKVSEGLSGLYRASNGQEQMLCTQFESTDARAAFPCFDEPTFKSQFAFTITTDSDVAVLANGPLLSVEQNQDGKSKTWTFAPTKPMSTYVAALVIGDLAGTAEEVVQGTPIRVWARRGKEHMGGFAHRYTTRLLPWFESYFDVPYHFDKYDQVAVPGFSAGAMENSGLVLFRQELLLMEPQTTSWQQEQWIAHVVAHEFAHMWFGNLVTMAWWDDLWLNEAFAEWVSTKAVNTLSPEYQIWDDFQSSKSDALAVDALETTHPIYSRVTTPAEAEELFDTITYVKGCAVLRMLETFLGEESFRAGVRSYMREFGERNAVGADLWQHLHEASREPIDEIMQSWITQSGHPIIRVAQGDTDNVVHIRQQRFFSNPKAGDATSQTWAVPLVIRYADDDGVHERRYLLREAEASLPLEARGKLRWCYANADEVGFYRQSLDEQLLQALLANVQQLTPSEQMALLRDQWAITRRGEQSIGKFLDLLASMGPVDNHHVLSQVVQYMHKLEDLISDTNDQPAIDHFRTWVARHFAARHAELGFEPLRHETRDTAQQRALLLEVMAMVAHDEEVLDQATQLADREAKDPSAVDPNLAGVYINAAAQFGDQARFDKYVDVYQQRRAAGATPQEAQRYLYSLSRFKDPQLVTRLLQLMDGQEIPQEAIGPLLRSMLRTRHTQIAAWEYVKTHWARLHNLGMGWIGYLVESSGQLPATYRDDLVAFYDANLNGNAQMSYARALEAMDQMAEFKARTRDDLIAWFTDR